MAKVKNEEVAKATPKAPSEEGAVTGVRIKPDLTKYVSGVSGSGKKTKRADNPISEALDGFTVEETAAVAQSMDIAKAAELIAKYNHLNVGMRKMNIANLIRGAVAKLDKMHEADKSVPAGLAQLKIHTAKGAEAVAARVAAKAKDAADRQAKAEAAAKEKAKAETVKAAKAA